MSDKELIVVRVLVCEEKPLEVDYGEWWIEEVELPTQPVRNVRDMVKFYRKATDIAKSRLNKCYFAVPLGIDRRKKEDES